MGTDVCALWACGWRNGEVDAGADWARVVLRRGGKDMNLTLETTRRTLSDKAGPRLDGGVAEGSPLALKIAMLKSRP